MTELRLLYNPTYFMFSSSIIVQTLSNLFQTFFFRQSAPTRSYKFSELELFYGRLVWQSGFRLVRSYVHSKRVWKIFLAL